jgi:myosin heavy chain 6/7
MDSVQVSLEAEVRAKQEAFRLKKKLESDINELEIALDHANKANSEAHKSVKRYQGQLRETEQAFENENRQRSVYIAQNTIAKTPSKGVSIVFGKF